MQWRWNISTTKEKQTVWEIFGRTKTYLKICSCSSSLPLLLTMSRWFTLKCLALFLLWVALISIIKCTVPNAKIHWGLNVPVGLVAKFATSGKWQCFLFFSSKTAAGRGGPVNSWGAERVQCLSSPTDPAADSPPVKRPAISPAGCPPYVILGSLRKCMFKSFSPLQGKGVGAKSPVL